MTSRDLEWQGGRPSVAVIVVNYNYGRYLAETLDSVLGQTEPFDEVIVVNDGSTDDSLAVIERYAGRVVAVDKANGGQLTATLAGLAESRADYVYVLDADDVAEPELVATVRPVLSAGPAKVQWRLTGIDAGGEPLMSVFPTYPAGYDTPRMREDNERIGFYVCPPTAGNLYRRAFLDALGLERLGPHEPLDGPPAMAAPYLGEVAVIDAPLARYRVHGGNDSRWDRPNAQLLQGELEWFEQRWRQVADMVGDSVAPRFDTETPLYVLERRLMLAALGDGRGLVSTVPHFLRRLWSTNMAPRQKLLLTGWSLALLAPLGNMRRALVNARRSPVNRSKTFKRMLNLLLGSRARPRAARAPLSP